MVKRIARQLAKAAIKTRSIPTAIEMFLLSPDDRAQTILTTISALRSNGEASKKVSKLAGSRVTSDDGNISRSLTTDSHQSASLVDRESPRVPAVGLGRLDERDRASSGINAVSRERVLLRAEGLVVADGGVEEVASDAHLGGLGGLFLGRRSLAGSENGQGLGLAEGEAAVGGVPHSPSGDGVAELVDGVQHLALGRAGCGRPPGTVAWTITGTGLGSGAGCELAGGRIDAEDADEVGAKVWREEVHASGIPEDGVRVRSVLAGGDRARLGHGELLLLQDLGAGSQRQLVGCDGGRVTGRWLDMTMRHIRRIHLTIQP